MATVWFVFPIETAKGITSALFVAFAVLAIGRKFHSVAVYSRRPAPPAAES